MVILIRVIFLHFQGSTGVVAEYNGLAVPKSGASRDSIFNRSACLIELPTSYVKRSSVPRLNHIFRT